MWRNCYRSTAIGPPFTPAPLQRTVHGLFRPVGTQNGSPHAADLWNRTNGGQYHATTSPSHTTERVPQGRKRLCISTAFARKFRSQKGESSQRVYKPLTGASWAGVGFSSAQDPWEQMLLRVEERLGARKRMMGVRSRDTAGQLLKRLAVVPDGAELSSPTTGGCCFYEGKVSAKALKLGRAALTHCGRLWLSTQYSVNVHNFTEWAIENTSKSNRE